MSGTVRDLLTEALDQLDREPVGPSTSAQAIAAIGHCGRVLAHASLSHEPGYRPMAHAIDPMTTRCQAAAATWPAENGRAEALVGSAADLLSRGSFTFMPSERWAVAVAVARTARSCAERARQFPPYAAVPQLTAVIAAAAEVQRVAMTYPPAPDARIVLDRSVPIVRPAQHADPSKAAEDSVAALAAAVHSRAARRELTMGDTLACAAVLEIVSSHATDVARALDAGPGNTEAWQATGAAWRAVQRSCAPFDDGTKAASPSASPVLGWASRLERALAADTENNLGALRTRSDLSVIATSARAMINQAPDIATDLGRGLTRQVAGGHLLARERKLPSYEARNRSAAVATNRVVVATHRDLADLATALTDARRLTMGLVRELDRTSTAVGRQTHPSLAAAHARRSTRPKDLAVLRVMADRAQRTASAAVGEAQWSYARRPPGPTRSP